MEFQPNEEQKLFINSKSSNVLVSASAGSGKTSTMIQKLIFLLSKEKVNIHNLLVLTYTEAAANEIKLRLYNELTKAIKSAVGDEKDFLKKQVDDINSAEIGTLHSVCKKLIIKYFYEINVSPDFSVLSEKEAKYLLDVSISNVFEKHILNNDYMFFDLYNSYNGKRNDESLKQMIIILYTYLSNKLDAKNWIKNVTEQTYNKDLNSNIVCTELMNYSVGLLKFNYKSRIGKLIQASQDGGYTRYLDFLFNRRNCLDSIVESKNFTEFVKVIANIELMKKPTRPRNATPEELDFDESVDSLNKDFSDAIKKIKEYLVYDNVGDILNNFSISISNVSKLIEIVFEIKDEYDSYKKNKNALDFNDLEDKMLELVQIETIREKLKNDYKFIFFDEYQDINEKQEKILTFLVSGDNYYMIGDVKQSIYAFRQSSPKIFINKFYKFQSDGDSNKVINFNKNYRSDRNILEFNNLIFDTLITEDTIGIDYKANSRFQSNKEFEKCNVDIKVIDTSDTEYESTDKEMKEALLVANTIADIMATKKSDGTKYTYSDIAIILRQRGTYLKVLCDTLNYLHIPLKTTISREFFGTSEICLMMSIVKTIANYKDDISLCTVLKNLFDFSEEELLSIRQSSQTKFFYEAITECDVKLIKTKIMKFFDFIDDARLYLSNHTIKEFLIDTINKFDILNYELSLPNGKERVGNIEEFISLSDGENYRYNLDKFIDYLEFVSKDNALVNICTGGNAVEISTIHHSKGLEYPVVIMSGLGKKFNLNKDTNNIIINENFGIGIKSIDSHSRTLSETLIRNVCKIKNKQNMLNEEIRLLYVAMTRPKERLIMIGQYDLDNFEKNKTKPISMSLNYFDMLFKCFDNVYSANFVNRKNFVLCDKTDSQANIEFLDADTILIDKFKPKGEVFLGNIDDDLKSTLSKTINSQVNRKTSTIKNTVTNILREEVDYENLNFAPKKLDISDRPINSDFLKLGTAYHSVMQNVKFTENKEEIATLIQELVTKNIISQELSRSINIDQLYNAIVNLQDIIFSAKHIYREKQFIMQENYNKLVKNSDNNTKVIVQGVIDLLVETDDGIYLIDYKTNRNVTKEFLIDEYALQLNIYARAFENATKLPITKKFLYSFYLNKLIEVN